jgi:hypothetical protein
MVCKKVAYLIPLLVFFCPEFTQAQVGPAPYVYQVPMYSALQPNGQFASVYTYTGPPVNLNTGANASDLGKSNYFTTDLSSHSIFGLTSTFDASIATALSLIPLTSPASGVIIKLDPATGAELPASSTLGPIFTERGETIGKHRFYVGLSNQDFHFTSFNGQSLKPLRLLDEADQTSSVTFNGSIVKALPFTTDLGADVRLSQDLAFFTYGVTSRFDVSVGLTVVHAGVTASTYNLAGFSGNGFANASGINTAYGNGLGGGNCWCVDTLTPGSAPGSRSAPTGAGLFQGVANTSSLAKTGFGDMLLRFKGTVLETRNAVLAVGADLRLPTGDAKNFLGTGATAVKPFLALSLYTKPLNDWLVISPHFNVGWQLSGKSILGGTLQPALLLNPPPTYGIPVAPNKDYLPDVFNWAVGTELALGHRNTVVIDLIGNQIGWIHGIPNMVMASVSNLPPTGAYTSTAPIAATATASGFVSSGRVSFGEYSGAFGYKAKIAGNLVGTFNMLVRFDDNGLVARAVPLFGLSYTF